MEIGPISGIGALQPAQADRVDRDLSGVFRVEFQREQQDGYTPHGQSAERGLEDEEDEPVPEEETAGSASVAVAVHDDSRVNFFA